MLAGYATALALHATARAAAAGDPGGGLVADRPSPDRRVGDYWTANITTVATGGQVSVRPVLLSCGRFTPYAWEARQSWYEPPATATFLVLLTPPAGANGTPAQARRQFGPPQQTARIGVYEVLVWNRNLLPALTSGIAPGCGPRWQQ